MGWRGQHSGGSQSEDQVSQQTRSSSDASASGRQTSRTADIPTLARSHGNPVAIRAVPDMGGALTRLEKRYRQIYAAIAKRTEAGDKGTRAEEWLLDNRHVVQESVELVRESLNRGFVRQLPRLKLEGGGADLRVRQLAELLVRQGSQPLDMQHIQQQVAEYQRITVLRISELWALPALLRLMLLQMLATSAETCLGAADKEPESGITAHDSVEVAGAVLGLRSLFTHDWRCFVEKLSRVERVLENDPADGYAQMDFATRDAYRNVVEELARWSGQDEHVVAGKAVELSRAQAPASRRYHLGYYLVDAGRRELEVTLNCRRSGYRRLTALLARHPDALYFGGLGLFSLPLLCVAVVSIGMAGGSPGQMAAALLLLSIPVLGFALALLNGLITHLLPPRRLPKLDFDAGIPEDYRTAVVVPVLLSDEQDVAHILGNLEINYLNNPDANLCYVLLSDFADATQAQCADDAALLAAAEQELQALNQRYVSRHGQGPFLLLHRQRRWNPAQGRWMGWERKRGKLLEFNRLLSTGDATGFTQRYGDQAALDNTRYVITLDADTHMPPGTARRLVAAMAHPLNRPVVDPDARRVVAGYGFLQPRIEIDPAGSPQTHFARIYSGDSTIDLYTHAVSDAYQDLFGEGIFAGKGIYDPLVFEQTQVGQLPENAVLSHDLLEGAFGGAALLSDTTLYEDYPPNIFAYLRRAHRWIRGDWQLLPWLRRRLPAADGTRRLNPLPVIHRWKIVDNLRRSLEAPALVLLLILAWNGWLAGSAWLWTLGLLVLSAKAMWADMLSLLWQSVAAPGQAHRHIRVTPAVLHKHLLRWLLWLAFLPYESWYAVDGIVRTLYRLTVTRRQLLEWTSAAHVHRMMGKGQSLAWVGREMWFSPVLALLAVLVLVLHSPAGLAAAAPLLLLWFFAPLITWLIHRPARRSEPQLGDEQHRQLRALARRTWFFFQHFMGPDDHWLPPDNYQEEPRAVLARRTSPTNIGLGLLSVLSAYDFGYIDLSSLLARLSNSFDRMGSLERYRGHFLNWYETRELRPLQPRYVSTVDSGNLAASLLTLARGLDALLHEPVSGKAAIGGILDTLGVLEDSLHADSQGQLPAALQERIDELRDSIDVKASDGRWWLIIDRVQETHLPQLQQQVLALIESDAGGFSAEALGLVREWLEELRHQLVLARRSQDSLQPWRRLLDTPPALYLSEAAATAELCGKFRQLQDQLVAAVTLFELPGFCSSAMTALSQLDADLGEARLSQTQRQETQAWNTGLRQALQQAADNAEQSIAELRRLVQLADQWVRDMDFGFLYDENRHLFHIGYNVSDAALDANYYDLLASEARMAGFVAIAKGDVPARHWLHLERPFRRLHGNVVLMSWGATLFEYLMPSLLMKTPVNSLLERACRNAITIHRDFTHAMKLPWGISESGYYELDSHQHYQYRAFGAPGLGFRRDVGDRIVVAPYASLMALPFVPASVVENLQAFLKLRAVGHYGLYEAIDFGRTAKAAPRRSRLVRSYMSHHQGMILLALNNFLNDAPMPRRFHSDPRISGLTPLLHEQLPVSPAALIPWERPEHVRSFRPARHLESWPVWVESTLPQYNLLSNGHYNVIQSARGGGGSSWQDLVLTRWRADPTCDNWGHWHYIQDQDTGHSFSLAMAPGGGDARRCSALFGPHQTEYQRREDNLFCRLRTAVASQHDVELRHLTIKNESAQERRLLLSNYAEVVLAPENEDQRHPAFAKLFIESRYLADDQLMLYRRRPRSALEKPVYLAHSVFVQPGVKHDLAWETDRLRFLGRGGTAARPQALRDGLQGFGGSTGAVLDPVIASGLEVRVAPHQEIEIAYLTAAGKSRRELRSVIASYRSLPRINWVFEQARMQSEQELANLRIEPADVAWMTRLMSALLVPLSDLRAPAAILRRSHHIQSALWSRGISGDYPILLLHIRTPQDIRFVETLLQAHTYCCGRGFSIDLLLIDESSEGYMQPARDRLQGLITEVRGRTLRKISGSVFVLSGKDMTGEERIRLKAAAHVVLDSARGSITDQLARARQAPITLPPFVPVAGGEYAPRAIAPLQRPTDLQFDNDLGGFSADGREYVMHLEHGCRPPVPWANVLANPDFGCLVTEAGSACTWSGNSGEHRLTPWHNDPVADPSGEVLYLRDEETAELWTPTPAPRPAGGAYQVRHGAGYSEYLNHSHGLQQRWRVYVDHEAPVKIGRLTLTNCWPHSRRITATYYLEWVLGLTRSQTGPHIVNEYDAASGTLLARNAFTREPHPGVAFLSASLPPHGLTTDRGEFMGTGGSAEAPAALFRIGLSGKLENGGDHCAAYQVHIDLPPGETRQVYFVLGEGRDRTTALALARDFSRPERAEAARKDVENFWEEHLGKVQIETGDRATDLLVNRWLPYQTLACRLWGRSGFYQSSGAFGFRDQLQDVLALLWSRPEWTRAHILKAASRQFQAGDVLHWWHEKPLRGVRTRCSDDMLWLPFVTASYVRHTGDNGVLRESAAYLGGMPLEKDENEYFAEFEESGERGSLYEHCCRAIERACVVGRHGLPVIGSGDWNDGFNRISTTGSGESVWLAWFLIRVCRDFAPLAEHMGDEDLAVRYRELAENLHQQIDASSWDGAWYRRAYYDDASPVGSAQNDECKIDLIAQAWSVLAVDTPTPRARQAMASAYRYLVRDRVGQILLLTPPFDRTAADPGYIKGYPPGIRENGGQYTHAATWAVWAAAGLGEGKRALELFRMLNPILHTASELGVQRYRTEPYVLAGDVYSVAPHEGRGGWTWYTGASAWLYRAALEALLGLRLNGDQLQISPCLPAAWPSWRLWLRHGASRYEIQVETDAAATGGTPAIVVDGEEIDGPNISLRDDGNPHSVTVRFGYSGKDKPDDKSQLS